ncbi:MAG TPA: ABC transporter permease subunit, partial [Acidimicrobiales bacterium]|nr:ABC transporter permease subunit [Acidimicrobiales bacterium]
MFYVLPVGTVLAEGLSAGAVADVVRDERLRGIAWFTLWQAVVSTALTVVVAVPVAVVLSRYRFRGRSIVWALVTVPFVLPSVVVAAAFVAVFDRGGPLASLDLVPGVAAILMAHVHFNVAVVARTVAAALATVDPQLEDAARMLGASRTEALRRVTLPLVRPALVSASSIVFLFTFTSFGAVLLLGGPRRVTIDVEIWRQTEYLLDLRTAAGLSVLQLLAVVAAVLVSGRLQARATPRRQRDASRPLRPAALLVLAPVLLFLVAPIVVTAYRSVDGLGLDGYRALWSAREGSTLFVDPADAVRNSLTFAIAATAIALVVGGCTALLRGRTVDALLLLPLGTSAVTVGLGFLLALDEPPLDLRDSLLLVPIAQALVALPLVVRTLVPVLGGIDDRQRQAAASL